MFWLFQSNPDVFRLKDALRAEALATFVVTAHKHDIHSGDGIILWQSGKEAGCYGLATVISEVQEIPIAEAEKPFFKEFPEEQMRVSLKVEYNLWNKPITWEMLRDIPPFEEFNAGLPGSNFIATEQQYRILEDLAKQLDVLAEPQVPYGVPPLPEFPLNLILYGPPGTGKTYQTINYALAIIENRSLEELALEDRPLLRQRFDAYTAQGQIAFVTFHQSFSYEDFIEGIKPQILENGAINYAIEPGIFRMLSYNARRCVLEALLREQPQEQQKVKFNQLYKAFLEFLDSENFEYFETPDAQHIYIQQVLQNGDLSLRPAIAFNTYTVEKNTLRKFYQQFPNIEDLQAAQLFIDKNIRGSESDLYWTVFVSLKNFENFYKQQQQKAQPNEEVEILYEPITDMPLLPNQVLAKCRRYVLIIDEINRGNAAAIFGELITLLEADKREGRSEALTTILPYSKSFFSVPPNLYLIGTMNTADRSVESLDIALRRRFAFREVLPDPKVIAKSANKSVIQGIQLPNLLNAINQRIERLLDREHCIGHAYFMDIDSFDELKHTFAERIIPLLQEYFYNDYAKIGLVLGKDFIREKPSHIEFANFDHPYAAEFAERRLFEIANIATLDEEAFIRIYER
ncbi:MAG: EVE domain-containing protein [Saprospiraceae bacterium]|nr:EVE domain-containing protein [Saprospiraceae bacterium]